MLRVGLISDTHGLLRPAATAYLRGCDHIIHAGDIGSERILHQLSGIAPVTAVRGNNDTDAWAAVLPQSALIQLGAMFLYVIHDLTELDIDPAVAAVRVVVSGHSHQPLIRERDGVIYANPGSAGPRRFRLPITVAELRISGNSVTPRITELPSEMPARPRRSGRT